MAIEEKNTMNGVFHFPLNAVELEFQFIYLSNSYNRKSPQKVHFHKHSQKSLAFFSFLKKRKKE